MIVCYVNNKVPTPAEIRLSLQINLVMMLVLASVIAANGYFTSGAFSDSWCMAFRSLLLGCSVASSTLIVGVWNSIVHGQAPTAGWSMRSTFAFSFVVLDLLCNTMLFKFEAFGGTILWLAVPMFWFVLELGNITVFTWRAVVLLSTFRALGRDSMGPAGPMDPAQTAFTRKTARLVLLAAASSAGMLSALILVGMGKVYYSSPGGAFMVGFIYVYSKAGVAASHVAICWPSARALAAGSRTKRNTRTKSSESSRQSGKVAPRDSSAKASSDSPSTTETAGPPAATAATTAATTAVTTAQPLLAPSLEKF